MRTRSQLKARSLIVGSALCCAFLGHAQFEKRYMAQRQQDASSVFFAFPLNGKIYESKLAVASIISAPGWIPSEPSPFPAHKAVEAAAPVARSAAGSLGSWRVSGIRLYSLGPPRTQSWYYGVPVQARGGDRSIDGVGGEVGFGVAVH